MFHHSTGVRQIQIRDGPTGMDRCSETEILRHSRWRRVASDFAIESTENDVMPDPQTPTLRWLEELVTGEHKEDDEGRRFADLFRDLDTGDDSTDSA